MAEQDAPSIPDQALPLDGGPGGPEHVDPTDEAPFEPSGMDEDAVLEALSKGKSVGEAQEIGRQAAAKAAKPDEEAAEGEGEGKGEEEPPQVDAAQLARAKKAIERLPKATREALKLEGLSDADIIQAGLPLADAQAETDRLLTRPADSKEAEGEGDKAESQEEPGKGQPSQLVDLTNVVARLEDFLGEDTAGALNEFGQTLARAAEKEMRLLSDGFESLVFELVRSQQRERFPMLADRANWDRACAKMRELYPGLAPVAGETVFERALRLMENAAQINHGPELAQLHARKRTHAARDAGRVLTPSKEPQKRTQAAPEDPEMAYLEARNKTGSHIEGLRAAGLVD